MFITEKNDVFLFYLIMKVFKFLENFVTEKIPFLLLQEFIWHGVLTSEQI